MSRKPRTPQKTNPPRRYRGADIPMRIIRRFAREVAERFGPDKIILFRSYAYGQPHADSDVDILVVMPARNQIDQAVRIELACDPPFPLDIVVRTPKNMRWRLEEETRSCARSCLGRRCSIREQYCGRSASGVI